MCFQRKALHTLLTFTSASVMINNSICLRTATSARSPERCCSPQIWTTQRGFKTNKRIKTPKPGMPGTKVLVCVCVLARVGACWCALMCVGVRRRVFVCVGVCWCVLVCVGVCWCVLVCVGLCWRVFVCAGVRDRVLDATFCVTRPINNARAAYPGPEAREQFGTPLCRDPEGPRWGSAHPGPEARRTARHSTAPGSLGAAWHTLGQRPEKRLGAPWAKGPRNGSALHFAGSRGP